MLGNNFRSCFGLPIINKIDTLIFSTTYTSAGCCSGGAAMDIHTFEKLVKHRAAPDFAGITWEGYTFKEDVYSPGGKGCCTKFDNDRCMFQNPDRGCSIHSYCINNNIDIHELKFFACCLFPVKVNKIGEIHHILTTGYEMCSPQLDLPCRTTGDTSVYETARKDIEYYYGRALITEIEKIKNVFATADRSIR